MPCSSSFGFNPDAIFSITDGSAKIRPNIINIWHISRADGIYFLESAAMLRPTVHLSTETSEVCLWLDNFGDLCTDIEASDHSQCHQNRASSDSLWFPNIWMDADKSQPLIGIIAARMPTPHHLSLWMAGIWSNQFHDIDCIHRRTRHPFQFHRWTSALAPNHGYSSNHVTRWNVPYLSHSPEK